MEMNDNNGFTPENNDPVKNNKPENGGKADKKSGKAADNVAKVAAGAAVGAGAVYGFQAAAQPMPEPTDAAVDTLIDQAATTAESINTPTQTWGHSNTTPEEVEIEIPEEEEFNVEDIRLEIDEQPVDIDNPENLPEIPEPDTDIEPEPEPEPEPIPDLEDGIADTGDFLYNDDLDDFNIDGVRPDGTICGTPTIEEEILDNMETSEDYLSFDNTNISDDIIDTI